jgi:signal transduction histidine kinase
MPDAPRRLTAAVALIGAACLLVVNEWSAHRARTAIARNDHVLASRIEIRRLQLMMLGAETGQRGYLITLDDGFAEPYRRTTLAVEDQLLKLRRLFQDTPERTRLIARVEELTRKKMAEMETTIALAGEGKPDAAVELIRSGIGRDYMRSLEALIVDIAATEQARMEGDRSALLDTLTLNRLAIAALLVVCIVAAWLHMQQSARRDEDRLRQAAALQAERDKLEDEVARRTRELREIAQHLQTAREDERSHLARELHDELGGLLTAAKLDVARMRSKLRDVPGELLGPVNERVQHLVSTLDAGIALKRRIIEDLRPSTLSNLGLKAALEVLCADFARRSELHVETDIEPLRLSDEAEITLFRVLQESLTNISRYAQARNVAVSLRQEAGQALLEVRDDGAGFDIGQVPKRARGLAGMRFRVESCAGSLELQSRPGQGTQVVARVPASAG